MERVSTHPPLPPLREDLQLLPGTPGEDGSETWLLYDPSINRYYRLGQRAFRILGHWSAGRTAAQVASELEGDGEEVRQEVLELLRFLRQHHLTTAVGPEEARRLAAQRDRARVNPVKWLVKNYLYIRIPLVNPDRFLERTLPWVSPLFSPWTSACVLLLGFVGLFLAARQWESFLATLVRFSDLSGLALLGATLFLVKACHELGHAYTAKRLGCRVPVMGVAFLVLYPMLYTDTTDSWRLREHRDRLRIALAGIRTELALALAATFAWGFLEDGVLRSAAFFVATVSWVMSLSINLSPFMRFDGYYALADWLGAENLQTRAFALARWRLRERLLGLEDPPPEILPPRRRRVFLVYAWATWVYRFFLFLGIALLVYHLVFKALGILLFAVEIGAFILAPVARELKVWWVRGRKTLRPVRVAVLAVCTFGVVCVAFVPWERSVTLPAVVKAESYTRLFPRETGRLEEVLVRVGQKVEAGQALFRLDAPELRNRQTVLSIRMEAIQTRLNRCAASARDLRVLTVLQRQMAGLAAESDGLARRLARLTVRAPFAGTVSRLESLQPGQWVSISTPLAALVARKGVRVEAFVGESDLGCVRQGAAGRFLANEGTRGWLPVKVEDVDRAAIADLKDRMLADRHGGPIPVREKASGALRPEEGTYRILLRPPEESPVPAWPLPGRLRLAGRSATLAGRLWQRTVSVLIRETGF